jgi:hypothetical protein
MTKKEWSEFRSTGLLLFINQILHVFGWAIVFEMDGETVKSVFPARVKFRGFDGSDVSESYSKITEYLMNNIQELATEAVIDPAKVIVVDPVIIREGYEKPQPPKPPIPRIIAENRFPDGGYDICPKCHSSRKSGWRWSKNYNYCINPECEYNTTPIPK